MTRRIVLLGLLFESGLAIIAILAGGLLSINPLGTLSWGFAPLLLALVALVPPLAGIWWLEQTQIGAFARLRERARRELALMFGGATLPQFMLLAAAAGFGEEVLFRGLLQPLASAHAGEWVAVLSVGLLFGVVHAITPLYAVIAGVMGIYLGVVHAFTNNLLVVIVVHSLYDAVAFGLLARWMGRT